jgi:hypothetical protein
MQQNFASQNRYAQSQHIWTTAGVAPNLGGTMLILSIKETAMSEAGSALREPAERAFPLPHIYERVSRHVPAIEWPALAPDVEAILRLKRERTNLKCSSG